MAISPYLNFQGNCREAVEFYADVFGVDKPQIMAFGDGPSNPEFPIPEEVKNWVMHAMLTVGGGALLFSDTFPGMPYTPGNNISIMASTTDPEELTRWYNKLREGGQVMMELQETFWSKKYGNLTDKFGIGWQLNLDAQ